VNGIIASPFGVNHMLANLYYNVHRLIHASAPLLLSSSWLNKANEVSRCESPCLALLFYCEMIATKSVFFMTL
jgi:hypothetical protein